MKLLEFSILPSCHASAIADVASRCRQEQHDTGNQEHARVTAIT
jgi:hypothetical protein